MTNTYHYLLGYGSLLSFESRTRYSQLNDQATPVNVRGWQRSWITQNPQEQQSHVGAVVQDNGQLNALLIKVPHIDDNLRQREKDYRFTQVAERHIQLVSGDAVQLDAPVWICESLYIASADSKHPVMQTYVDTCLVGCLEAGGIEFARCFIQTTSNWNKYWLDDRLYPRYPRRAEPTVEQIKIIDQLLHEQALLNLRQTLSD